MKTIFSFFVLFAAITFCGIGERLTDITGGSNQNGTTGQRPISDAEAETAEITPELQTIIDAGTEMSWDAQGIKFTLPTSWKKMNLLKESLLYSSPDNASLIASISVMADDFPADSSLVATYNSAIEQMKQGKYEKVRYLEIDGVKGVEWTEAMPELPDGPRRHQWIAFRRYQGQNQQLNIMLATKGTGFEKDRETFKSVMYSMSIPKG